LVGSWVRRAQDAKAAARDRWRRQSAVTGNLSAIRFSMSTVVQNHWCSWRGFE